MCYGCTQSTTEHDRALLAHYSWPNRAGSLSAQVHRESPQTHARRHHDGHDHRDQARLGWLGNVNRANSPRGVQLPKGSGNSHQSIDYSHGLRPFLRQLQDVSAKLQNKLGRGSGGGQRWRATRQGIPGRKLIPMSPGRLRPPGFLNSLRHRDRFPHASVNSTRPESKVRIRVAPLAVPRTPPASDT